MSQSVEEDDSVLKDLVTRTLQNNGVLGKIQAQLRASVFLALEDEFKSREMRLCSTLCHDALSSPAGRLAASLVHDFLTCLGLDFSLSVYGPESNLGAGLWKLITHDDLVKTLNIQETDPSLPVLHTLCTQRAPVTRGSASQQAAASTNSNRDASTNGSNKSIPSFRTLQDNTGSTRRLQGNGGDAKQGTNCNLPATSNVSKDTRKNSASINVGNEVTHSVATSSTSTNNIAQSSHQSKTSNSVTTSKDMNAKTTSIGTTTTTVQSSGKSSSNTLNASRLPPSNILSAAAPSTGSTDTSQECSSNESTHSSDLQPLTKGMIKALVAEEHEDDTTTHSESTTEDCTPEIGEDLVYSDDFSIGTSSKSDPGKTKSLIPLRDKNSSPNKHSNSDIFSNTGSVSQSTETSKHNYVPNSVATPDSVIQPAKQQSKQNCTSLHSGAKLFDQLNSGAKLFDQSKSTKEAAKPTSVQSGKDSKPQELSKEATDMAGSKQKVPDEGVSSDEQLETEEDISLDFLSSEASSAREETEDVSASDAALAKVNYEEQL